MPTGSAEYVLVTGATGFIGAHVVDSLLRRGIRYASRLDFVEVADFAQVGVFDDAIRDVDAVVHVASPFTYQTTNNERELIIPAINGVKSILSAAAQPYSQVRRIVLTSSFAAVLDASATRGPDFVYTGSHWNPLTYDESVHPDTSAVVAYRGSKKFAELEAWNFVENQKPSFDLVTLCPPMTFGPVVHPCSSPSQLNESNAMLWSIATGANPLPVARVPVWVDVRDLAEAHAQALLTATAGGKRYVPSATDFFSYQLAADIMRDEFDWAKEAVFPGDVGAKPPPSYQLDGQAVTRELGVRFRSFRDTVVDLIKQVKEM